MLASCADTVIIFRSSTFRYICMGSAASVATQLASSGNCPRPNFYSDLAPDNEHVKMAQNAWNDITRNSFIYHARALYEPLSVPHDFATMSIYEAFYTLMEQKCPHSRLHSKNFVDENIQPLKTRFVVGLMTVILTGYDESTHYHSTVESFAGYYEMFGVCMNECKYSCSLYLACLARLYAFFFFLDF